MKNKGYWLLIIFFLAAVLFDSTSCKKQTVETIPQEAQASDEALFKLGEQYIKKDTEKGILYLRQVIDSFPKSFYAQRAKLLIADSYFNKGDEANLILAAAEYREFISLYPTSPSVPYCQYQIAMTYYKKILKPGRDQTNTLQALQEFKKVVTNYPSSDYAKQAEEKIKDCEQRLAENEFQVGLLYYKIKAYRAAVGRLQNIPTQYPEYKKMDAVYFYLADSYFQGRKYDESFPYFTKLISDYPQSKFVKMAQKRLQLLDEIKKANNLKKGGKDATKIKKSQQV
ncbi:MAG: outer membrane protein assembly factor BamD [Candidatus Saccharicenans sp.]|nr:MAG: outer membrane protein assembly factor BamD [Candidatus Aminicenantes bacterium]HEK85963.1 outer membrane protein assembly factor BamD [Candidatus Aminicenantes bacterium]